MKDWRKAILLAALFLVPTTALGSTTSGDRQAIDVRTLKMCIEMYFNQHGEYPSTDSETTWFQKLVQGNWLRPEHIRCGTTIDGTLPVDLYGRPLVYEVLDPHVANNAVIRSVGKDGIDNHGRGDDFDSRYGANLGYWNKSNWPEFFAYIGAGWFIAFVVALATWHRTHRIAVTLMILLLTGGVIVGVMSHFFFDGGVALSSASRIPPWGSTIILYSLLALMIGIGMAVIRRIRSLRRAKASQRNLCCDCGYDLRATSHERCPECGAGIDN